MARHLHPTLRLINSSLVLGTIMALLLICSSASDGDSVRGIVVEAEIADPRSW